MDSGAKGEEQQSSQNRSYLQPLDLQFFLALLLLPSVITLAIGSIT